jgi:hypothetical protein
MPTLGTKKFWRPIPGQPDGANPQILKMSGYISVVLQAVHYRSQGTFWQKIFGGTDKVAVTSQITYQYGEDTVVATALQDVTTVRANADHYIANAKTVALKIPADADGLELRVDITAIENDNLQSSLQLLNSDEFRKPLELAPPVVGTVLTVTSLVKKLFTNTDPQKRLQGTYPGVISQQNIPQPLSQNRLVSGYLILISTDDDTDDLLDTLDESQLSVEGDTLRYKGIPMSNTYLVYNISLDERRGINARSPWYAKYREGLLKLNELRTVADAGDKTRIYNAALALWNQGNGLIEADRSYLEAERDEIEGARLAEMDKRYKDLTTSPPRMSGTRSLVAAEKRNLLADGLELLKLVKPDPSGVLKAAKKYSQMLKKNSSLMLLELG